ncbi:MAG: CobB/CobQ domain-containing protein glutamine amidotransferase [Candidatus Gottesmanbacteria bacterium GW2011_GWA2_43_14]|uniref:Lipid II isoglutaminyl synthase (glutamine-hydrolyzing) subunit GatD n=1 Tax=Candidatus Gottesmanbacteria bacterium GW2011_GWA2_43_14 TaxID=1618443 RepID=A0A0G1DLR5_9BACT|nr:MAG: CobB/CobQ domain-containing protein glutamine amidotransferase [Candidatus Gottesmanbacteria bacterium GW2011_GWA2_43_14]
MKFKLTIAWLYPDLMSTYGDRGNLICLEKRCSWRKIEVEIKNITLETGISELLTADLLFMGGAQDRQQKVAADDFIHHKGPVIKRMINSDIPALFVCAAYQAAGYYYKPYHGKDIPGAGIFDLYTEHPGDQKQRLIGNCASEIVNLSELKGTTLVGFENHGGRTYLGGKMKPLAKVLTGGGNNGEDGFEGGVYRHAIGSYYHGPLLPKNPQLADWLIARALEVKYRKKIKLQPLVSFEEKVAHKKMLKSIT